MENKDKNNVTVSEWIGIILLIHGFIGYVVYIIEAIQGFDDWFNPLALLCVICIGISGIIFKMEN